MGDYEGAAAAYSEVKGELVSLLPLVVVVVVVCVLLGLRFNPLTSFQCVGDYEGAAAAYSEVR